jgi:hypothetical protein
MKIDGLFGTGKRARPTGILSAIILSAMAVASAPSAAASTPEWLRAATQTPLPKYAEDTNAVVLLDEQITTVTDAGEIKTMYRRAFRILRSEGRNRALVAVYFDNETRLTRLKAWSIPAGGKDYEVKEKDAV